MTKLETCTCSWIMKKSIQIFLKLWNPPNFIFKIFESHTIFEWRLLISDKKNEKYFSMKGGEGYIENSIKIVDFVKSFPNITYNIWKLKKMPKEKKKKLAEGEGEGGVNVGLKTEKNMPYFHLRTNLKYYWKILVVRGCFISSPLSQLWYQVSATSHSALSHNCFMYVSSFSMNFLFEKCSPWLNKCHIARNLSKLNYWAIIGQNM